VETATRGAEALVNARAGTCDVVVLELNLPDLDGLDFLRRLDPWERPEVILRSASLALPAAVEAMKLGAFDCLLQEAPLGELEARVRAAAGHRRPGAGARRGPTGSRDDDFVTRNVRMREILDVLAIVAVSNASVLLTGESGTGKDLLARTLHRLSPRAPHPFVDVNCAALSESLFEAELFGHEKGSFTGAIATRPGLVEAAAGGTLFLDEVAEMPPAVQAKLLRMTEDRSLYRVGGRQRIHVDVRIVAATNRDVPREIAAGRLREDLYYRLAGVEITVPPLRDRPEDLEPLAAYFLERTLTQNGRGPSSFAPAALQALRAHPWPGNVRELRNVVERTALLVRSSVIERHHLPPGIGRTRPAPSGRADSGEASLRELERREIERVLMEEGWHRARAAKRLGLPLRTLYRRIKTHSLGPSSNDEA
jgi:DNA-binding NtrC family response regulator